MKNITARNRVAGSLAVTAIILLALAATVTIWANARLVLEERSRNPHEGGGMAAAIAAWGVSPYLVFGWIAWRVRSRAGPAAILLAGALVIATPVVAFMTQVAMHPGGDGQLGLALLIYPFIQWLGVVIVGAVCVVTSQRRSRGFWIVVGAIAGFCIGAAIPDYFVPRYVFTGAIVGAVVSMLVAITVGTKPQT